MRSSLVILAAVVLTAALGVANLTWWVNTEIVDGDRFVDTAVTVLERPSSREAVATLIVERLVDEIPLLLLVDDVLVPVFSEILGTEPLREVLVLVSAGIHERMVTGDTGPIVLDLEPYHDILLAPVRAIAPDLAELVPDSWFAAVVVLEDGTIPDVSPYVAYGRTVGLLGIVAAIASGLVILLAARRWEVRLGAIGAPFAVAGGLSLVAASMARQTATALYGEDPRGVLVVNLYDELVTSLTARSSLLLIAGVALVVAGITVWVVRVVSATR